MEPVKLESEDVKIEEEALTVKKEESEEQTGSTQPVLQPMMGLTQPVLQPVIGLSQPVLQQMMGSGQPVLQPVIGSTQPVLQQMMGLTQPVLQPVIGSSQPVLQQMMGSGQPVLQQMMGSAFVLSQPLQLVQQVPQNQASRSAVVIVRQPDRTPQKVADHGYKCYVPDCSGDVSTLHTLPADKSSQEVWLKFIYDRVPAQVNSKLMVCSAHFTPDCFSNQGMFQAGFASRLILKKGAVPTIPASKMLTPKASTSQQQNPAPTPRKLDKACQTDPPPVSNKGTQLSMKTLSSKVRSRAVQASVLSQSIGTITTEMWPSPPKRARVEYEEEEEEEMEEDFPEESDAKDSDYNPAESETAESVSGSPDSPDSEIPAAAPEVPAHKDAKFIVFEQCLLSLFEKCPVCSRACKVRPTRMGTYISVNQLCPNCEFSRQWSSQPLIASTPVGNLQLSAAIYFSGVSYIKIQRMFKAMNLKMNLYSTFRRHAKMFLEPTIIHKWNQDQNALLQKMSRSHEVVLAGKMRADIAGKALLYGSYSMVDLQTKLLVDVQLVQSAEREGKDQMQTEGLRRSLERLQESGVELSCLVTDTNTQVQTLLKERNIRHYYDVRHVAKGLSKKMEDVSKEKGCGLVKKWNKTIVGHLHYSATTSESGQEKISKWRSIINHLQDVHTHDDPIFPQCHHSQRLTKDSRRWFQPGSRPLCRLEKVLMNQRVLSDVEMLSPHPQTSTLQSFNRLVSQFAPKEIRFPFVGMLCRLYLAAMQFNESRSAVEKTTGRAKHTHPPPSANEEYANTEETFSYIANLMDRLFEEVVHDPVPYLEVLQQIPVPQSEVNV
ncbi:uncharacterized protein si:ch73-389k6.1 isoform X2 [Danio aesculapii]|uniref:uncharacterized protein si:ch73-389k6.1 isoform X2 n=1 Tax=Danio aesculapii TaxID=1142201 RepID=UPI0024BF7D61|nr:uncharacterized protein si:ch73-389k6.1 isoform X2 [Danio aesculapii]